MTKIIITVKDGLVQEVFCNGNVCVEILDFDTTDGDEIEEIEKIYDDVINDKSYKDIL